MPRVTHIVVTNRFAGVERYVSTTANETAARGWSVTVVGGSSSRMRAELDPAVDWLPGDTTARAVRSILAAGTADLCHTHMTYAEGVAVVTRTVHRAPILTTRHFAGPRGTSRAGRLVAPFIERLVACEIAISSFVADRIETEPDAVIPNGVRPSRNLWRPESRCVLVMQRFDPEKDTVTALEAWRLSRLAEEGWRLRVLGSGQSRYAIEEWLRTNSGHAIELFPWSNAVDQEFESAGILLAPAPGEPLGLTVLEAMAAGVPVAAAAAGGHLETVGLLDSAALFTPGDPESAANALRTLATDHHERFALSHGGRELVNARFTVDRHVDRLLEQYEKILTRAAEE